jgi:hypothetical protein
VENAALAEFLSGLLVALHTKLGIRKISEPAQRYALTMLSVML